MDLTILFEGVLDGVTVFGQALVESFKNVTAIFYDSTPTTGGLTIVGYLLIAVLSLGLIRFALNTILRLFTRIK